jgi:nephrocystin-3
MISPEIPGMEFDVLINNIHPGRTVRVFISSTFRDFGVERDLLMKRVFPELRRRARDRFVQVIGVDLRWGVTEEDSQQGETLPICLREIDRSRPYFIGLLGERYGWTPSAGQYPELLLAQQPWLAAHAGGTSVTELEVLHGVLNNPEMAGRAFFYFRDAAWSDTKGPEFRSEGTEDQAKLARLKDGIRASAFPVVDYATPEAVADRITDDLWTLIDQQYPEDAVPDEIERERRSHEAYAAERRRLYVGQDETLARLLARLEDASDEPGEDGSRTRITLVTGESGTGKSALLANTLNAYREAHPNDVVIEHYIGSTSDASDPVKLMRRVAEEIQRLTGSTTDIETDAEKLVEQFVTWIADASYWAKRQGVRFVLVLDALDKLESRANMRWLPRNILPHVRIVVSSLEGEARDALANRGIVELEAARFSADIARRYVTETLAHRGRKLPGYELDRIIAHPKSTLPLFLKTLVEELSVFGSYEGLPTRISECLAACEPDDLFEIIFARLEEDFGRDVVQKPLEAIAASSDGMSDDELLCFTGLAPLALARLKLALDDTLYEAGGLIRMSHAYAQKGVQDRYTATEEARRSIHRELGLWWEVQEPGARMAWEMDYQLFKAEAWDDLCRCLVAPRTGMAAVRHLSFNSWFASWRSIAASRGGDSVTSRITDELGGAWQEWRERLDESHDSVSALRAMTSFLWKSSCVGDFSFAVCVEALAITRGVAAKFVTHESRRDLSLALDGMADIEWVRGDILGALACYEEGLQIRCALMSELGTVESRCDFSFALTQVAGVKEERGDLDGALAFYEEGLQIRRALMAECPMPLNCCNVMVSLNKVAGLAQVRGDLSGALVRYGEGLAISRALMVELGTPESRRDVSLSLGGIARVEQELNDLDGALVCYREILEIARALMVELGTPQSHHDLSVAVSNVAGIEEVRGDLSSALVGYEEGLEIARALMSELGTHDSCRSVLVSLNQVGRIEQARGDLSGALVRYEEGLEIARIVMAGRDTPQSRRDVSLSLGLVADVRFEHGDIDGALACYEAGLEHARALMSQLRTPVSRSDVQGFLGRVARVEAARGNLSSSYARYGEVLQIARALMVDFGTPESRRHVSVALNDIGGIEEACGDFSSAYAHYDEGLTIARALMAELRTPETRRDVSVSLRRMGGIEEARGDLDGAFGRYVECLQIDRALVTEFGTPQTRRDVGISLGRLGRVEQARGDIDSALAHYEEGLMLFRALMAERSTPEIRRDVSLSLELIADIEMWHGDVDGALAHYQEGLQIRQSLMTELGTPASRRDVSVSLSKVAGVNQVRGELDSALVGYEKCLQMARALMAEFGTPESRRDVSIHLNKVADIEQVRGDLHSASARYKESIGIARTLLTEAAIPKSRLLVIFLVTKVATIEEARGYFDSALPHYEEALDFFSAAMTEAGTTDARSSFLWTAQQTATCLLAMNRSTAAHDLLQSVEAIAIALESDARDDGNVLDTVAAYWERRAEAASHTDPQEVNTCAARAASIRALIARGIGE